MNTVDVEGTNHNCNHYECGQTADHHYSLHAGKCLVILSSADLFQSILLGNIGVEISLNTEQARRFVGSNQGANCLQRLSTDETGK